MYQLIEHIIAAIMDIKIATVHNNFPYLNNERDEVKT